MRYRAENVLAQSNGFAPQGEGLETLITRVVEHCKKTHATYGDFVITDNNCRVAAIIRAGHGRSNYEVAVMRVGNYSVTTRVHEEDSFGNGWAVCDDMTD